MLYPGLVITQLQSASRNVINQSSSIIYNDYYIALLYSALRQCKTFARIFFENFF